MYHTIEFVNEYVIDLEISPRQYLERVVVPRGVRLRVEIKPYVVETQYGPMEIADLYLDDGTVTRGIRFDWFSFVE